MKIVTIIGARPQFIKALTLSRALARIKERRVREVIIHTGQHYDDALSEVFFRELVLPKPDYHLGVGSAPHGRQTGEMLGKIEEVLRDEKPGVVVVYGDTNSTLAGALAAAKLKIPVAHVEAGLRSRNKKMPEEINRIVADHCSSVLFCPSRTAVNNLQREGFTKVVRNGALVEDGDLALRGSIDEPLVMNVGDIMYDGILLILPLARDRSSVLKRLGLEPGGYYLATIHRQENTDDPKRFEEVLSYIEGKSMEAEVIFPMHPRMKKACEERGRLPSRGVRVVDPVGYLDMVRLLDSARLLLTDSGGMQKEAFWLDVPCITLREETEWVETVSSGKNRLFKQRPVAGKSNPLVMDVFGRGNTSRLIAAHLYKSYG